MSWILVISVLVALGVGFLAGRLSTLRTQQFAKQDLELQNTKNEFERYKTEVSEHLRETSELMLAAEQNYQQLSEQLKRTKQLISETQEVEPAPHGAVPEPIRELPPKDYSGAASGLLQKESAD